MEYFFQDPEVQDVVENHMERVTRLEDAEAERVMRLYKEIRRDLRDRLDAVGSGTFTAEKMRGALVQVETAIQAMNQKLYSGMEDGATSASALGVDHLITEINKWNRKFEGSVIPINLDAAVVATDSKNFLINRYQTSIDAYSEAVRSRLTQGITEAAIAQQNYSDVVGSIGKWFMGEEWKLHQIVRTELHNVYSQGKLRGMNELWDEGKGDIPDLMKTLFHPMDKRTGKDSVRLAQNNPIVPVDEPFVETSTGKKLVYMAPPNRPNDRAILVPYREGWGKMSVKEKP